MNCKNCGAELQQGTLFCTKCGHKVDQPDVVNQANQFKEPIPTGDVAQDIVENINQEMNQSSNNESGKESFGDFAQQVREEVKQTEAPFAPQGKTAFPVPQGFVLDERNGLYYLSDIRVNPETSLPSQFVQYFNPITGELFNAFYPLPQEEINRIQQQNVTQYQQGGVAPQGQQQQQGGGIQTPQQQPQQQQPQQQQPQQQQQAGGYYQMPNQQKPKKNIWPIVLVIILSVLLLAGVVLFLIFGLDKFRGSSSSVEESSVSSVEEEESSSSEPESSVEPEEVGLKPITDDKEYKSENDIIQNSFIYANAKENEDYIYFTNAISESDVSRYLRRYDKKYEILDNIIDAGENQGIYSFALAGDYIVYCILPIEDSYFDFDAKAKFYMAKYNVTDVNDSEYIFSGEGDQLVLYDGYVYLIMDSDMLLRKIGIDKDGDVDYEDVYIDIDDFSGYIYDENTSIVKGKVYFNTYDVGTDRETMYTFDLETEKTEILYTGPKSVAQNQTFITDNKAYFTDLSDYSTNTIIEYDFDTKDKKEIYSTNYTNIYGGFIAKYASNLLYLHSDGFIHTLPLGNIEGSERIFEAKSFPFAATKSAIIMEEHIYRHDTQEVKALSVSYAKPYMVHEGKETTAAASSTTGGDPYDYYSEETIKKDGAIDPFVLTGYLVANTGTTDYTFLDVVILEDGRMLFEYKPFSDAIIKDGYVNVEKFAMVIGSLYSGYPQDIVDAMYAGSIKGFIVKDGKVSLDSAWKPTVYVASVTKKLSEDSGSCEITITTKDGEKILKTVTYYENTYGGPSYCIIYNLVNGAA